MTAISGNNVTISPGLFMPNWRSSQNPGVWWASQIGRHNGLEDLTVDLLAVTVADSNRNGIEIGNCYECWTRNIRALFGPNGKVVYVFGADRGSTSRCYGVCATAWPPLLTTGAPLAGSGVQAKLLGTTKRKNGTLQVTYNGHPLYYYSADKVGKVMCQHANMHGGLWLVIKPNGQPNTAKGKMHM